MAQKLHCNAPSFYTLLYLSIPLGYLTTFLNKIMYLSIPLGYLTTFLNKMDIEHIKSVYMAPVVTHTETWDP